MNSKLRYRLGLDLGTTSIGWCVLRLDSNNSPVAIIRMGSRIFSDSRNPKNGSSLAAARRLARQMRRRRDRLLQRKQKMRNALIEFGFFPKHESERKKLLLLDPYALRKAGLDRALTPGEFARALFHINQRRGFRSNRKTDDAKDSDSRLMTAAISKLDGILEEENCRTLGEWLANRHAKNLSVRARLRGATKKDKAYFYADRKMIEREFNTLWQAQAAFHPDLFNDEACNKLRDILLFQRPLKSVDPGRCSLIPDEKRAHKALICAQRVRIYQEVNHLCIQTPELREQKLSQVQRDVVVAQLEKHSHRTFKQIIKALKLPSDTVFNLQDRKRDRLNGNQTSVSLAKKDLFGARWFEFSEDLQDAIVEKLLNEEEPSTLLRWLQEKTEVDTDTAQRIADASASLPAGYGNLGRTALQRILPHLKQDVIVYSEAVTRAGFDSHSALSHSEQTGEVLPALPYYGEYLQRHVGFGSHAPDDPPDKRYGRIANPTVHVGLNQLRRVVNALIKRYGHPQQVIVEVTRDLKLSPKRKKEVQDEQADRQKRNRDNIEEACTALGRVAENLNQSQRRELSQKIQLWKELGSDPASRRCPYTGEQISIERLLSAEVEIEHILPFSITLDDSMNNKTVAMRGANRDKGNRTPYDAFGKQAQPGYDYAAMLERAAGMPKDKRYRFAEDGYQRWRREHDDFLARALNDTAYFSRIAKEYLSLICPANCVWTVPGRLTGMLRGLYGLNQLLSGNAEKNRNDHRHHALDAAVIGITDRGLLQRFATASAKTKDSGLDRLVEKMPDPWPDYRAQVKRALNAIVVSQKPDHGYQGAMHEESAWGFRRDNQVTRRETNAETGLRTRKLENKNLIRIHSTRDSQRHGIDESGSPKAYKGYVGGSNYCIEIFKNDKGKWQGDVISTFQAYQIIREHGEEAGWKKLRDPHLTQCGHPLIMRLMNNDCVRLTLNNCCQVMRIVKISGDGKIVMAEHHEANVDARNRDKEDPFKYTSKLANPLRKADAKPVTVSEIGVLRVLPLKD